MKADPRVAVIIPNYGDHIKDTLKSVRSVLEADYQNKSIIVVDDGSEKVIQSALHNEINSHFPLVKVVLVPENKGFASACNKGADIAVKDKSDLLFFLNNDAVVKVDAINHMVREFENDRVAIVGPKIYLGKTNIINSAGGFLRKSCLFKKSKRAGVEDEGQFDQKEIVDYISGCAFMVRTDTFKELNGFDEVYYMYAEEIDFCLKCTRSGYLIVYQPQAVVWHEHAKTMKSDSLKSLYYLTRNRVYLTKKYLNFFNFIRSLIILKYKNIKTILLKCVKRILVFNLAIIDGIFNKMGKRNKKLFD